MSMNETPSGERIHIGFFGRRNAGKSSLVNAVTGQDLAVVSDTKGTTTDPVRKAMELLPLGPVMITDTPGFDDEGNLGQLRVQKTRQELNRTDIAVLVVDATEGLEESDRQLLAMFREKGLNHITVYNKSDLLSVLPEAAENEIYVSAASGYGVHELKERLAKLVPQASEPTPLGKDLFHANDLIVLVTPIDASAPKGRLILPQQMMIREILDANAMAIVTKETQLAQTLNELSKPPALVITDSQVFREVAAITPKAVPLTSFSILMARHKGFLADAVRGVSAIERLQDGDTVLISEGCTHHRQCGDIGSIKLPAWLKKHTGKDIQIALSSGMSFPEDLSPYSLILHCGGCMLNSRELHCRTAWAKEQLVPMTNYGIAIAYMQGILERSIAMLPEIQAAYTEGKSGVVQ